MNKSYTYFLSIAETGSITKAASANYVSQSSMTQYLKRLEEDLGVRLFDRCTSPMTLTEAGSIYLKYTQQSMSLEETLKGQLDHLKHDHTTLIRIGISQQLETDFLSSCLPQYIADHPNTRFEVKNYNAEELEHAIADHQCDIGFCFVPVSRKERQGLHVELIQREPVLMVCNRKLSPLTASANAAADIHTGSTDGAFSQACPSGRETDGSLEHPIPVSFSDLQNSLFILPNRGSCTIRTIVDDYFEEYGFATKKLLALNGAESCLKMLHSSGGISFIPKFRIDEFEYADELAYLQCVGQPLQMDFVSISPEREDKSMNSFRSYADSSFHKRLSVRPVRKAQGRF